VLAAPVIDKEMTAMSTDWYGDVLLFHNTFGHAAPGRPVPLPPAERDNRIGFMVDELMEFMEAETVEDQADAMIDLIYFALGTLVNTGVNPAELWDIVHQANMAKRWPDGTIRHDPQTGKVLKPAEWQDPRPLLIEAIARQTRPLISDRELGPNVFLYGEWLVTPFLAVRRSLIANDFGERADVAGIARPGGISWGPIVQNKKRLVEVVDRLERLTVGNLPALQYIKSGIEFDRYDHGKVTVWTPRWMTEVADSLVIGEISGKSAEVILVHDGRAAGAFRTGVY
jgi:predicted HAD superfamily Cof-like phosphohydrolase